MGKKTLYLVSLPERLPRAAAAGVGGVLYESSLVLLPEWARGSQLYQALLGRMLRITVEWAGGMPVVMPADPMTADRLTVRKLAGNAVELTSILTVGWSPLWMLAAAADLTGGTQVFLHALTEELKQLNILPPEQEFASVDGLLESLEGTTGVLSRAIDIPPLDRAELQASVEEMRTSWQVLRENTRGLPNGESLKAISSQIQQTAERENTSVWVVSSLVGLGAVRAGISLGQANIFDYYRQALSNIGEGGLAAYIGRAGRPYLVKAAVHLDPQQISHTEKALMKAARLASNSTCPPAHRRRSNRMTRTTSQRACCRPPRTTSAAP